MRVHSIPADKGYTFSCSRKAIGAYFGRDGLKWMSFGSISRRFAFDTRTEKRPRLSGTVVAALTFCPDGSAYLCLYPVQKDAFAEIGKSSFAATVLPRFRAWLDAQHEQAEVASSSHKEIIAEWTGSEHLFHEAHFLYATQ